MPKLSDLGLTNEQIGQALDYPTMPDQFGAFPDPPYPGTYRFRFPARVDDIWETFDHTQGTPPGKRIRARFDENRPLVIIQSPDGTKDGEPFQTGISNAERKRGRKEDPTVPMISDMDYFFRDVFGLAQQPQRTNVAFAQAFMAAAPNVEFTADIEWNWFCNPKKDIYVDNGQGGYQAVEQQKGCGASYYQKDIKDAGMMQPSTPADPNSAKVYPLRITCACGANIRAFPNLTRFRK